MKLCVRPLQSSDEQNVAEFLSLHTAEVFYIRSNMAKAGILYEGKPYQADYFIALLQGTIVAIVSHNWIGSVQIFSTIDEAIQPIANCFRYHLLSSPRPIDCFLGPERDVHNLICNLHLNETDLLGGHRIEKLYTLSLKNILPQDAFLSPDMTVRRALQKDAFLLSKWRHDFFVEVQKAEAGEKTLMRSQEEISRRIQENSLFILELKGEPVSYCGLSGFLSDWTMVGPVWTPVSKRSRGYGRIVTAGSLIQARNEGCKNAVLFTLNPYAEKAYKAIGFEETGNWSVNFLKDKEKLSRI